MFIKGKNLCNTCINCGVRYHYTNCMHIVDTCHEVVVSCDEYERNETIEDDDKEMED